MSLRIIHAAISTEKVPALHEARLLLLLYHAGGTGNGTVEGITKLAKLDFLLRYPTYLSRLLPKIRKRPPEVPMEPYERDTVESKMIRFRYGPWDPRYRGWIGILVAKALVDTYVLGRTVHVRLTDRGRAVAQELRSDPSFVTLDRRAEVVAATAGKQSGTRLKELVYEVVPELSALAWGEEIEP